MKNFPVESAYTVLCTVVDDLPMANAARREELLIAICALPEGFMQVIRVTLPKETRDEFLDSAARITDAANQLRGAWPNQAAYAKLHSELARFILVLPRLRGKHIFENGA